MVKKCINSEISRTAAVAGDEDPNLPVQSVEATSTKKAAFQITNTK